MTRSVRATSCRFSALAALAALALPQASFAQPAAEVQLEKAAELIRALTDAGDDSIPTELLIRARGIAVIPNVFRGGFLLGARRGRGILSLRMDDGSWSNPAFVTLTGGSIGWQIGAESTDIVLIFANDNAVRNMASGKFTLGGEASAIAGPLRRQASSSMTFRAEVYGYLRSRGLYAGAAFQGARLRIDEDLGTAFYDGIPGATPLGPQGAATPSAARPFLLALEQTAVGPARAVIPRDGDSTSEAQTFPVPD
ncbi:MAG TPA: lipid-binding SYLF domain-containing protein [Gammaproteobacteria bacterium]|nr:lipid-binding SYLF domain-containing protein [Gammaproteobacteria bacterium]